MALIVQKFGGTSVADLDRIRHVATRVKQEIDRGNQVIVTVSAMAGTTDTLVGYVRNMSSLADDRAWAEHDFVVSTGEQVTSGLLALCLQESGIDARAYAGWQLPFRTDNKHGKSRIENIDTQAVKKELDAGKVIVVAGFQGVTDDQRISTLGRGGSDTTAVALAAAFHAERCDIYTDVDGIYTCDPRIVPKAQKMQQVSYEEMLEMASLGAKVLQTRSVEMAMNHNVKVQVLSTFSDEPGTMLVDEEEIVEEQQVTGIAYSRDEARVSLTNVENVPGVSASLFGPLADRGINVDMIIQNVTEDGKSTDVTFTVPRGDLENTIEIVKTAKRTPKYDSIHSDKGVVKVSVIGTGMRSHAGVASKMFRTLADKNINIMVITTSEIKVSVLIEEEYLELALRALHTAYGLDAVEE
ncbi:MAG: aspartate kinase [Rickettsiales bacterium]|nr:aspartate kinase [Rickettsiales bacterium]